MATEKQALKKHDSQKLTKAEQQLTPSSPSLKMIAVTIGVGEPYESSARLAAACLEKHTGLESIVLNRSHFIESGLPHPAALKLRLFDLVESESILFFDADWFCVNPWSPSQFSNRPNVVACRDFVTARDWPKQDYNAHDVEFSGSATEPFIQVISDELRRDYIETVVRFNGLSVPPSRWINTGMFIINRSAHQKWLREADSLYATTNAHHARYFEQPALMKAIERLNLQVDLLPRQFNIFVRTPKRWPGNAVGIHVKLSREDVFAEFVAELIAGRHNPDSVRAYFLAGDGKVATAS